MRRAEEEARKPPLQRSREALEAALGWLCDSCTVATDRADSGADAAQVRHCHRQQPQRRVQAPRQRAQPHHQAAPTGQERRPGGAESSRLQGGRGGGWQW